MDKAMAKEVVSHVLQHIFCKMGYQTEKIWAAVFLANTNNFRDNDNAIMKQAYPYLRKI